MRPVYLTFLILAGCPTSNTDKDGDNGADTGDNGGDNGGDSGCSGVECWVNVTEQYVGDTTCFDGTNWGLGRVADSAKVGATVTLAGVIEDFQSGDAVEGGAQLDMWFGDNISGTPDIRDVADASTGRLTVDAPACQPTAYKTYTPADWEETVDTYEVHQVYGADETSATWNSVSVTTSRLIPSLLGLEWTEGTGIIAGTAYDCNENGIEKAQVYIHDDAGNAPDTMQIRYFANNLPNANQPYTNTDGLWSAINVPPGEFTVEMWVSDNGTLTLLGATRLSITPDSVNISNIYTGIEDGIYLPDSCLAE